jgi:uncharacterized protein YrzB (UPF0473 family)
MSHESDESILDESDELEFVTLVDDDGKEDVFAILLIVEFEGQEYAALTPAAQLEDDESEEQDIFLFVYEEDEDEDGELIQSFSPIEDEAVFEQVSAFCESQLALLAGVEDDEG